MNLAPSAEVKAACQEYLDTFNCGASNGDATDKLVAALDGCDCDTCKDIVKNKDFLAKKSQWIFGGDGEELPQIEEHPVALAIYILSPNN